VKNRYAVTVLKTNGLENREDTVFDVSKKLWCAKHGVDYIEITELDPSILGFSRNVFMCQKYQCIDICENNGYEKILNLDYDVVIHPRAPVDVFSAIESGIAITHDGFANSANRKRKTRPFKDIDIPQNKEIEFVAHTVQGGFFLYCRGTSTNLQFKKAEKAIEENMMNWGKVTDQTYITYLLHKHRDIEFKSLTRRHNYLPIYFDSCAHLWNPIQQARYKRFQNHMPISTRYNCAYFIHYCGFDRRLTLAEKDWEVFTNESKNELLFEDLDAYISR
jgi:hypothetical protein